MPRTFNARVVDGYGKQRDFFPVRVWEREKIEVVHTGYGYGKQRDFFPVRVREKFLALEAEA